MKILIQWNEGRGALPGHFRMLVDLDGAKQIEVRDTDALGDVSWRSAQNKSAHAMKVLAMALHLACEVVKNGLHKDKGDVGVRHEARGSMFVTVIDLGSVTL